MLVTYSCELPGTLTSTPGHGIHSTKQIILKHFPWHGSFILRAGAQTQAQRSLDLTQNPICHSHVRVRARRAIRYFATRSIQISKSAVMTVWPSGLRRWLQAPVRKGVGSNPTAVILSTLVCLCLNAHGFVSLTDMRKAHGRFALAIAQPCGMRLVGCTPSTSLPHNETSALHDRMGYTNCGNLECISIIANNQNCISGFLSELQYHALEGRGSCGASMPSGPPSKPGGLRGATDAPRGPRGPRNCPRGPPSRPSRPSGAALEALEVGHLLL